MKLGHSNPWDFYVGDSRVVRMYLGALRVYPTVPDGPPVIFSPLFIIRPTGNYITYQIEASNEPTSFLSGLGATGSVLIANAGQTGLALNSTTGEISGSLGFARSGAYQFPITATNAIGSDTKTLRTLIIPQSGQWLALIDPNNIGVGANTFYSFVGSRTNPVRADGVRLLLIGGNLQGRPIVTIYNQTNMAFQPNYFSFSLDGVNYNSGNTLVPVNDKGSGEYGYDSSLGIVWQEIWISAGATKVNGTDFSGFREAKFSVFYDRNGYVEIFNVNTTGMVGTLWVARNQASTDYGVLNPDFTDVAYGNGKFVAVTEGFTTDVPPRGLTSVVQIRTSTDGITWSDLTNGPLEVDVGSNGWPYNRLIYANNLFITYFWIGNEYFISSDGTNWTKHFLNFQYPFFHPYAIQVRVAYGMGYYIATDNLGQKTLRSTDAINWFLGGNRTHQCTQLEFGNNTFVAMNSSGTTSFSTDGGATWQNAASPPLLFGNGQPPATPGGAGVGDYVSLTYGNGLFVAIAGLYNNTTWYATSPDGSNWTMREYKPYPTPYSSSGYVAWYDFYQKWSLVRFLNGRFYVFSANLVTDWPYSPDKNYKKIASSADGINWEIEANPQITTTFRLYQPMGAAYGAGRVVAVGEYQAIMSNL